MITDEAENKGYLCSSCGRTIRKDESSFVLLDPKSAWWEHLYDNGICAECMGKIRKQRKSK